MNNSNKNNRNLTHTPEHLRKSLEGIRGSLDQFRSDIRERWRSEKPNKWPVRSAVSSIVLGILTFAFLVWNSIQTLINNSHFIQAQRAYVVVNKIQIVTYGGKTQEGNNWWSISPVIENGGNTPTKNLKVSNSMTLGNANIFGISNSFQWNDIPQTRLGSIGPKNEIPGQTVNTSSGDLQRAAGKIGAIEMAGVITYDDVFDDPHRVEFCFDAALPFIDFDHYPVGQSLRLHPALCPKHNCTDKEC